MKLFLVSQKINGKCLNGKYDAYISFVAAADSLEGALSYHPDGTLLKDCHPVWGADDWVADVSLLTVTHIGEAAPEIEAGVLIAKQFSPE